jgi:predicted nucleotidyltransferase
MKEEVLQEIKKTVLNIDSRAEVILFGSHARGDTHKHSDWDFLSVIEALIRS